MTTVKPKFNNMLELYCEDGAAKVRLKEPITKGLLLDEHIEKLKHMSANELATTSPMTTSDGTTDQ